MKVQNNRDFLVKLFKVAVDFAHPKNCLYGKLPTDPANGRTIVLGAGKAAAAMAEVAHSQLSGTVMGCVVTRHGHGATGPTGGIEVIEASHPVPDQNSILAGQKILSLAQSATEDDRVIFLISGGGSALLCDPIPGLSLHEKANITNLLVKSGAPIEDINLVRRHLSNVKGGRLAAAAYRAEIHTFVISDVVGDDPALVASGPSISCAFNPERAIEIMEAAGYNVTDDLRNSIISRCEVQAPSHNVQIIAKASNSLNIIQQTAQKAGWIVHNLGGKLEGAASDMGRSHAAIAIDLLKQKGRHLLLSGGELTVKVNAKNGKGGPNLEYLTGLMQALGPQSNIEALAADSDGIDGSEDNAGAYMAKDSILRLGSLKMDCTYYLENNDCYTLFEALGGLIKTGPTRTNVNDIRMIAIEGRI